MFGQRPCPLVTEPPLDSSPRGWGGGWDTKPCLKPLKKKKRYFN